MEQLTDILKILSDKNRIRILKLLKRRKMCVCELAFILRITQPSVSRHLKKLKEAQLIAEEQDSLWTNYYLAKTDNPYATSLLKNLGAWLTNDPTIVDDIKKSEMINRKKLCCK